MEYRERGMKIGGRYQVHAGYRMTRYLLLREGKAVGYALAMSMEGGWTGISGMSGVFGVECLLSSVLSPLSLHV